MAAEKLISDRRASRNQRASRRGQPTVGWAEHCLIEKTPNHPRQEVIFPGSGTKTSLAPHASTGRKSVRHHRSVCCWARCSNRPYRSTNREMADFIQLIKSICGVEGVAIKLPATGTPAFRHPFCNPHRPAFQHLRCNMNQTGGHAALKIDHASKRAKADWSSRIPRRRSRQGGRAKATTKPLAAYSGLRTARLPECQATTRAAR